jgi:uncharacterized membrane protein
LAELWLAHNAITNFLERSNSVLLRLNFLLLMVVSFMPFPTTLLDEYIYEDRAERVTATIYGTSLLLASALTSVLCRYAVHERLVRRRTAWTRAPNERSEAPTVRKADNGCRTRDRSATNCPPTRLGPIKERALQVPVDGAR